LCPPPPPVLSGLTVVALDKSAKTVTLQYHAMWKLDVNTGVVSYPTAKKRYATRDAQVSRRASSRNSAGSSHKSKFPLGL